MIDLGPRGDSGAPLSHVISNGSRAFIVCLADQPNPHWDGTYVTVVSPAGTHAKDPAGHSAGAACG